MGSCSTLLSVWEKSRLFLRELCQHQPESAGQDPCLSYLHTASSETKLSRFLSFLEKNYTFRYLVFLHE